MPMLRSFIPLLLCALALASCSRRSADGADAARLGRIADFVSSEPRRAADSLVLIDAEKLSDPDHALFGLLSVKAADKADIRHTSDSLILSVIRFYTDNPPADPLLLPEALYYGGRVSSDLGDYPRALRCFHDALAALASADNSRPALDLRARILSQTAFLLQNLRLHTEAIPILCGSVAVDHLLADSVALCADLSLLGKLYTWDNRYAQADSAFAAGAQVAESLPDADLADIQGEWAALKRAEGKLDSARLLIATVPKRIEPEYRSYYSVIASRIYLGLGVLDSALFFARDVIASEPDLAKRANAYRLLLDPRLRHFSHPDTLMAYVDSLQKGVQKKIDGLNADSFIFQNSAFNYSAYERANEDLTQRQSRLLIIVLFSISLTLLLALVLLFLRFRYLRRVASLRAEIFRLGTLRRHLCQKDDEPLSSSDLAFARNSVSALRSRLTDEIKALSEASRLSSPVIDPRVVRSSVIVRLLKNVENSTPVSADSPVWDDVIDLVCSVSPDFLINLSLLSGTSLSDEEIHLALLIRLGFSPSQISVLIGRTRGTITYRRRQLLKHAFTDEIPYNMLDNVIRIL